MTADQPFDEQSYRRPDFVGDVPVVLSDGKTWYFPKARARYSGIWPNMAWIIGGKSDREFAVAFMSAVAPLGLEDGAVTAFPSVVAVALLMRNYMLNRNQAAELLWAGFDRRNDPSGRLASWERIDAELIGPAVNDVLRVYRALPPAGTPEITPDTN